MMDYIVIDIGCLECEIESKIVGKYFSKEKAEKIAKELLAKHRSSCDVLYEYKDHDFKVFEIPTNYS